MKKVIKSNHEELLNEIRQRFSAFSLGSGTGNNRAYPDELKNLIVSAARYGVPKSALCRASGVAHSVIYYWTGTSSKASVRTIEVVDPQPKETDSQTAPAFVIRFASGTTVELNDLKAVVQGILAIFSRREARHASSC